MKTNYLLIDAAKEIDNSTKFLKVRVGTTERDSKCLQYLTFWATGRGFYFQKYTSEVADFLSKIADSLHVSVIDLPYSTVDVGVLVRHVKSFNGTPSIEPLSKSASYLRSMVKPTAYFKRQINVIRHAEAKQRIKPKVKSVSTSSVTIPLNVKPSADGRQL